MITLNGIEVDASIYDIIHLLKDELIEQGINLFHGVRDTPYNLMVSCPYHKGGQEKRPSAGIKKSDGTFHCFACGEVHTLPEIISHCFGKADAGAYGYAWLIQNFATVTKEERRDVELDLVRNQSVVRSSGNSTAGINDSGHSSSDSIEHSKFVSEEELDRYRYIHPYMYKRGLTDEIIDLFDIGYDKETECLTFPIKDIHGNVLFIARRSVKTKFFNYPAGAEKPLYGLYEYYSYVLNKCRTASELFCWAGTLIVTESMLDALSFWCIHRPAVALNGLGNELQIKQLIALPCRDIILATDMDEAGQQARRRLKQQLGDRKLIYEYRFPNGKKDANECTPEELLNLQKYF